MENPYATPASTVSNAVAPRKWYVSFARFLCYVFLVLWTIAILVSLLGSIAQFLGNTSSLIGSVIGSAIVSFILIYPLYSFLKLSGRNPDRKPRSVILFNMLAFIFAVGLFVYMAVVDSKDMMSIYIFCAVTFSFSYLLNAVLAYRLTWMNHS